MRLEQTLAQIWPKSLTVSLFSGRHELPENEGPIFGETNNPLVAPKTKMYDHCLKVIANGGVVRLYVTGATPALSRFLSDCSFLRAERAKGALVLYHYDRDTNGYIPQLFFADFHVYPKFDFDGKVKKWDENKDRVTPDELASYQMEVNLRDDLWLDIHNSYKV